MNEEEEEEKESGLPADGSNASNGGGSITPSPAHSLLYTALYSVSFFFFLFKYLTAVLC